MLGTARPGRYRRGVTTAARIALVVYLLAGASITLGPTPDGLFDSGVRTARDASDAALSLSAIEAAANIALFVPLGFLLCRAFPAVSRWLVWGLCVAASAAVELYQYSFPGRDATLRDLVTNSLGAALGVGLSWVLDRLLARRA